MFDDEYYERRMLEHRLAGMTEEQRRNNPDAEPMGHFTGRCSKCGSANLWDDGVHYGCNNCDTLLA